MAELLTNELGTLLLTKIIYSLPTRKKPLYKRKELGCGMLITMPFEMPFLLTPTETEPMPLLVILLNKAGETVN